MQLDRIGQMLEVVSGHGGTFRETWQKLVDRLGKNRTLTFPPSSWKASTRQAALRWSICALVEEHLDAQESFHHWHLLVGFLTYRRPHTGVPGKR